MTTSSVYVAVEVLERLATDRAAGQVGELAHYLALFPGHETLVAEEYLRARRETAPSLRRDGDPTEPPRVGPYTLVEELGRGGQAVVWKAHDELLDRHVALKVVARGPGAPDLSARFRREARATAGLDHPNICTLYDAGVDEGSAWIAMRLIDGVTLDRWLQRAAERRRRPDDPPDAAELPDLLRLMETVARALHAAHEQGVVHRDVKPGNIMVRPDGTPVVLDFGVAWLADESPQLTISGTSLGTPAYMSPEQLASDRAAVGPASDVWSLGATLYEVCTGQRAFPQPTRATVIQAILDTTSLDPRRVSTAISRDLAAVIQTALNPELSRRYGSARELAEDLRRVREGRPTQARALGPVARTARWARRNPAVAGLSAALFVASVTAGALIAHANLELSDANTQLQATNAELQRRNIDVARESQAKTDALEELARESDAKAAALADYERMADAVRIQTARDEAAALFPPHPDLVPELVAWQQRHAPLFARLASHEATLAEMRAGARPWTEADRLRDHAEDLDLAARIETALVSITPEAQPTYLARIEELRAGATERLSWDFGDDVERQFRHDQLAAIVRDLADLSRGETSVAASIAERLELSRRMHAETVERYVDAWRAARERVAAAPIYAGLELTEQVGLVPLGPDPRSGLEEFLLWQTHPGEPPERDADGGLQLAEDSGIVLVLLPPGEFLMGAQARDPEGEHYDLQAEDIEWPVHAVSVDAFLLGKHELTQAQWHAVTADNPSGYLAGTGIRGFAITGRNPVERVSWHDAQRTLGRLGLMLPTEAQWEYGARAGTEHDFAGTSDPAELGRYANSAGREVRGHMPGFSDAHADQHLVHAAVGSYEPNAFGLHDMTGNVWEWCRDRFASYVVPVSGPDGERTSGSDNRIYRGGAFHSQDVDLRVTVREEEGPGLAFNGLGVRVARRLDRAD